MARSSNHNITPGFAPLMASYLNWGTGKPCPITPPQIDPQNPNRCSIVWADDEEATGGGTLQVWGSGSQPFSVNMDVPPGANTEGPSLDLKAGIGPFPVAPTRDKLLGGKITGQGLWLHLPRFGWFPWWPPCWAWLTQEERASCAAQLIALGEELTCVEVPCGPALYDESGQFYSPDNGFGPLDWTNGNSHLDDRLPSLIAELLRYGFKGVWLFFGGDAGQAGVPIANAQAAFIPFAFKTAIPGHDLNDYVVYLPGWDGVWHAPNASGTGWNPPQFTDWEAILVANGAKYWGMEHAEGYAPVGEGGTDFQPGGRLYNFALILGEYNGPNPYQPSSWQLLGRFSRPFAPMQPWQGSDDPNPPYYLANWSGKYRVWEYDMYGHVRNTPATVIAQEKQVFVNTGAPDVC